MASLDAKTVWIRYSRKLGDSRSRSAHSKPLQDGEEWSDDDCVTHAVQYGRTLCGVTIRGGLREGWTIDFYARHCDSMYVSCRKCRRSLEKNAA